MTTIEWAAKLAEWFHDDTAERLAGLADELVGYGLNEERAREIMEEIIRVVRGEYGE